MRSIETVGGLQKRLQRQEIDRIFRGNTLLREQLQVPRGGWLRSIRAALGMTAEQLGRRLRISQNAISEAEAAELEGGITIKRLQRIAAGLDCDLVYVLVPRTDLDGMVHDAAERAARRIVGEVTRGMDLEAQSTDRDIREAEIAAVRDRLIAEGSSTIWD